MPENESRELDYLFDRVRDILSRNGSYIEQLPGIPGGLRLRTGKPTESSVNFRIIEREA